MIDRLAPGYYNVKDYQMSAFTKSIRRRHYLTALSQLKMTSAAVKEYKSDFDYGADVPNMNTVLKGIYALKEGTRHFRTASEWQNEGFQIRPGEVPFPIWGKPNKKAMKIIGRHC